MGVLLCTCMQSCGRGCYGIAYYVSLVIKYGGKHKVTKFTTDLSNLLQHNVVTVSGRLLEKGLVTKDIHDYMYMLTTEGVFKGDKASCLVSCVFDRIKGSSRCFHEFIAVLREDSYYEDLVLKILAVHGKDCPS